jgi:hypothetical protein
VDGVFIPLVNLKTVMLAYNKLKQIPIILFQYSPKLTNVDLSHNALEQVPVNSFRGSPIKELNLSNNRFTYLLENFCLELHQSGGLLKNLYFAQNPWQCACLRDIINEAKVFGVAYDGAEYNGANPVCVTTADFRCQREDPNIFFTNLYYTIIDT